MKLFRIIGKSIRDAFRSLFRNFSLSMASVSSISITLLIVSVSLLLSVNVDHFAKMIKDDVTVIVFLDRDISDSDTAFIQNKITKIDNVDTFEYYSKEENLDDMKKSSEALDSIMSEWDESENPLQATILLKVKSVEEIKVTADTISEYEGVSLVKYGEGMVEKLIQTFKAIEKVSYVVVLALIMVSAFLISNTIKLTITARRKEIEIMRLVGASNIVIKTPFVIEGIFIGILGSIFPIVTTIYGYNWLYENFDGQLFSKFIKLVNPIPYVFLVSGILLGISILVSMLGSGRAVRRYLKI